MTAHLQRQLQALADPVDRRLLTRIQRGIEKESLRLDLEGRLAQTPHPAGLGAPLTHKSITTDYSEALLEFITPVETDISASLNTLADIHSFVYHTLDDEILWAASMPCIVSGDEGIPVAQYGSSNVARMKTVYRYGLGHRYGRKMQTIAGIHYNFSMPAEFWQMDWESAGSPGELRDHITNRYLGLIRNFRRYSWLLIYLYGASPAVCSSFLRGRDNHGLRDFDPKGRSLYLPQGTSLRMGDLGYNSDAQKGLNVCYNSLDFYVDTLRKAIMQPHPPYDAYSCGADGDYQQLNNSLLQIENEFYSPIRPKRVAFSGETALHALHRGGIEYIEVRCIDVNPFTPLGIDAGQIRFLDSFLLYCLLADSPACEDSEQAAQASNLAAVVNRGREPGLKLHIDGRSQLLTDAAMALLAEIEPVAELLGSAHNATNYQSALDEQRAKISDPGLTPSARVLQEMHDREVPFFRLAMGYSEEWANHFRRRELTEEALAGFEAESRRSVAARETIEREDVLSFDEYLKQYFDQYRAL